MNVLTRDATPADLPAIDAVFRRSFSDTFAHLYEPSDLEAFFAMFTTAAWSGEYDDPDYAFRVAEVDGEIVGYVKLGPPALPVDRSGQAMELRQIYLLKDFQGRGIAQALTRWAIAEARRRRAEELYLTVYTDNQRARRLYERHGFEVIGQYDFMVGSHADQDLIMRKRL